jgi:predicted short-subunit dehydrogenase-like oxidoreductase (DUF2520 family)
VTQQPIVVVGPGRVGLSLARALVRAGHPVTLLGRTPRAGEIAVQSIAAEHLLGANLVVLAVADDAIASVASLLARSGAMTAQTTVLHTSGLHGSAALAALAVTGAALGSFHPLQSFADPTGDPDALCEAPAVIEGDDRALVASRALALALDMSPIVEVSGDMKALYHAGAVFASNYVVVLAAIAIRLAKQAGANADATLFLPLMQQTIVNLAMDPSDALTGPIRRGDAGTVAAHLAVLGDAERALYCQLGREALNLARTAGLDDVHADAIQGLLRY